MTMEDTDYWPAIVNDLGNPVRSTWASYILAVGLGRGDDLEDTNLGKALQYVPRAEIVAGTVRALQDEEARPYCNLILWYFEPEEVIGVYRALSAPHPNISKGVAEFLREVESPYAEELAREQQRSGRVIYTDL